ncbi:diphosphate--fructose-6-phosphate 1-phosphotransferase [Oscillospiraceae bacterium MB08-C2-2]|nr:diphosphate--fructose-6-phosphate 1-phosphotransferase [Oscillospiraceae bacterium MB08-C2-2]
MKKLLIIHGGGPTAVINASLYGAITEARRHSNTEVYAAIGGTGGLLKGNIREVGHIPQQQMELLLSTPGSAIGTSRDHLEPEQYVRMAEILKENQIGYVLCNGGNGSMDMCGKLYAACKEQGFNIRVMGIPKTMDNDLAITDHSPGYGSAARYIAQSVQELCADVRSLPIHVVVLEASGRNAGWITAASAMARKQESDGPDLIYVPERPFIEAEFLEDVSALIQKKKSAVVVVSEGLTGPGKEPLVPPVFKVDRSVYYGDISAHLANMVIQKLGYKARSEKPGLLGRASIAMQSSVDLEEAKLAGELACTAVLEGESGKMVAFKRVSTSPYKIEPFLVEIEKVMLTERTLPDEFINARGNYVTDAFTQWCKPLLGAELPDMVAFN